MNATQPAPRRSSTIGPPHARAPVWLALALLAAACGGPWPAAQGESPAGGQAAEEPRDSEPRVVGVTEAAVVVTGEREWRAVERVPEAVAAMFEPGLRSNLEGQREYARQTKMVDWQPVAPRCFRAELDSSRVLWGVVLYFAHGQLSHEFVLQDVAEGRVGPAYRQRAQWWSLLDPEQEIVPWRIRGPELAPLRVTDLDGDGRMEIALKERMHNGTVDNIDLAIYAEIGEALELVPVLALKHRCIYSRDEWERVVWLEKGPTGSLQVDVHKLGRRSEKLVHLGSSRLTRGDYLEPYVLADTEVFTEEDRDAVQSVLRELP